MPRQFRTGGQTFVRHLNRSLILDQLRLRSPLSRADLAGITGLNKTTVSSLVDELMAGEFVREIGRDASGGGRPGVLLELNPDAGCIIGAEISVGQVNVILTDFRASIFWRRELRFDKSEDLRKVLGRLTTLLRQAVQQGQRTGRRLFGAGLTIPGLVDVATGTLIFEPNMGWRDVPLLSSLASELDVPIFVDNDANAAALAERYLGVAQDVDDFAYVVANIGLGAGLVIGGHIFQGASGFAGEAGHTTIDPDGPLCRCGNHGCWERLASQRALIERVQTAVQAGEHSVLGPLTVSNPNELTTQAIVEAARGNDAVCLRALTETGRYLGIGIANLINTLNPSLVAFGGALSLADEFLMPVILQVVQDRAMEQPRRVARVVVSAFKADACVMGGVALVLHDILSRPRLDVSPASERRKGGARKAFERKAAREIGARPDDPVREEVIASS